MYNVQLYTVLYGTVLYCTVRKCMQYILYTVCCIWLCRLACVHTVFYKLYMQYISLFIISLINYECGTLNNSRAARLVVFKCPVLIVEWYEMTRMQKQTSESSAEQPLLYRWWRRAPTRPDQLNLAADCRAGLSNPSPSSQIFASRDLACHSQFFIYP